MSVFPNFQCSALFPHKNLNSVKPVGAYFPKLDLERLEEHLFHSKTQ